MKRGPNFPKTKKKCSAVELFWLAATSLQERNINQANRWWPELITPIHLVIVNNKHDLWKANAHSAFIFTRWLKRARKNKPSNTWKIHLPDTPEVNKGNMQLRFPAVCVCSFPRVWKKILNTNHLTVWNNDSRMLSQNALSVNVRLSAYFLQRLTGLSVHLLWRNVNTAAPQGDAKRSQVYRSV